VVGGPLYARASLEGEVERLVAHACAVSSKALIIAVVCLRIVFEN
jgi:hypothetical protein